MITPEQVLASAAVVLERDGWCQQLFVDSNGARCAVAAIRVSSTELGLGSEGAQAAIDLFKRRVGITSIVAWNDLPERTAEQVIGALRGE